MKTLYVLCGIPASGKTTWALNFIEKIKDKYPNMTTLYVSRDNIRKANWDGNTEHYFHNERLVVQTYYSLLAKSNADVTIADATHIDMKSRERLMSHIRIWHYDKVVFKYFKTPLRVCLERNAKRAGFEHVPESVIKDMYVRFQHDCLNKTVQFVDDDSVDTF